MKWQTCNSADLWLVCLNWFVDLFLPGLCTRKEKRAKKEKRKVACVILSGTPTKMWQGLLSRKHFCTPIRFWFILCIYCWIYFCCVFVFLFLDISFFCKMNKAEKLDRASQNLRSSFIALTLPWFLIEADVFQICCIIQVRRYLTTYSYNISYKEKKQKYKQEKYRPLGECLFSQAEPLGGCRQDLWQMTIIGLLWSLEEVHLHLLGHAVDLPYFDQI